MEQKPKSERRVTPERRANPRSGRRWNDNDERQLRDKHVRCPRCASAAINLMERPSAVGWVLWLQCTDCRHVWNVPKSEAEPT